VSASSSSSPTDELPLWRERLRLEAGEGVVAEVEDGGGGERAEPQARPPPGERAGADGLLEGDQAEDGVEEGAQPVMCFLRHGVG
jgi:hypothetical protein